MRIEVIKCKDCGAIGLAVDDERITDHKCSGAWSIVMQSEYTSKVLGRLLLWTREYGVSLCPGTGDSDSFGDGMRSAKQQVSAILRGGS